MADTYTTRTPEQRATLALWALTGVGVQRIRKLGERLAGGLGELLALPEASWSAELENAREAREELARFSRLEDVAQHVEGQLARSGARVAFPGEADFPRLLIGIPNEPPLIFLKGAPVTEGFQLAMVGSRATDAERLARKWGAEVARRGVCVVSGAAMGIDEACHRGALDVGGKTWAFLGSSIDQIDPAQAKLAPEILGKGGTLFSELPPGVRANKQTFPRRNRLISGASHAVLVVRAGEKSGALHTVEEAEKQGRPVFAIPAELGNPYGVSCNRLIRDGRARLCMTVQQVVEAVGVRGRTESEPAEVPQVSLSELSPTAQRVYAVLQRVPLPFEDVLVKTGGDAAQLVIALTELELCGLAIQHPGKRYERL